MDRCIGEMLPPLEKMSPSSLHVALAFPISPLWSRITVKGQWLAVVGGFPFLPVRPGQASSFHCHGKCGSTYCVLGTGPLALTLNSAFSNKWYLAHMWPYILFLHLLRTQMRMKSIIYFWYPHQGQQQKIPEALYNQLLFFQSHLPSKCTKNILRPSE